MVTYAIDFESYFDSDISLTKLSVEQYLKHPDVDIYLVAIVGDDGTEYCGSLEKFNWHSLPEEWTMLAHNARFDLAVYREAQSRFIIPESVNPTHVYCTADMTAYLTNLRSLKEASAALLKTEISKEYRKTAKGKHGSEFTDVEWRELVVSCLNDASTSLMLWIKYNHLWPEWERTLSQITRDGGMTGINIDRERTTQYINDLTAILRNLEREIPWDGEWQKEGKKTPLARKFIDAACVIAAIPKPLSLAKTDERFQEWVDEYGDRAPWVEILKQWAGANRLLSVLQTALERTDTSNIMTFGLKYFGAGTTGRWSGDSGYNMQNMLWKNFGQEGCLYKHIDHRSIHVPQPGHVFIVADYAQIEPRSLNAFVKNRTFLEACKTMSAYEAEAVKNGAWNAEKGSLKKEDPARYAYYKAQVLSCGYGAGWRKVVTMMAAQGMDAMKIVGADATEHEMREFRGYLKWMDELTKIKSNLCLLNGISEERQRMFCKTWLMVRNWRAANPDIVAFWLKMQTTLDAHCGADSLIIRLPSGRKLTFYHPRKNKSGDVTVATTPLLRPQDFMHLYGAKIVACCNQANARDILGHALVRLHNEYGISARFSAHDEGIFEVPQEEAEDAAKIIKQVMTESPAWMPHIPLDTKPEIVERYCK